MKTPNYYNLKKGIIFILILFFFSKGYTQSPVLKTWVNIGYSQKVKVKKFKVELSEALSVEEMPYYNKNKEVISLNR